MFLSLFIEVVYCYLYLLFTTFPVSFGEYYKFSVGLIGLAIFGVFSDKVLLAKAADGEAKPEFRLIPMVRISFTVLIALFL